MFSPSRIGDVGGPGNCMIKRSYTLRSKKEDLQVITSCDIVGYFKSIKW